MSTILPQPASRKIFHAQLQWSLALFYLAWACSAGAQGELASNLSRLKALDLDQLIELKVSTVYSASRHEQSVSDAPSSVTILTGQDFQHYGYRTLAEALQSVRGFDVSYDRYYNYLGVRGVNRPGDYGGRNLLLLDGHRMNEPIFDSVLIGYDSILDPDLIDRVEIIRGPGSALYGNNAFFSVINVIPKRGSDYRWGEVSGDVGSLETYKGRFTLGHAFESGVDLLFSASAMESSGRERLYYPAFDDGNPQHNGGVAENLDYLRAHSFYTRLSYRDFTLSGAYSSREKGVPTAYGGTLFNDSREQTTDDQAFVDLKFERQLSDDWSILARTFYGQYLADFLAPYDPLGAGIPDFYSIILNQGRARWAGGEFLVGKRLWDRHQLTFGGEARHYFEETGHSTDEQFGLVFTDLNRSDTTWGAFINAEIQLYQTNLTFHAGGRYDDFSAYDSTLNPRLALIGRPWAGTALKFLYGHAYRAPNLFEAFYSSPFAKANPQLNPETIRSHELVWEQTLSRHFRSSVSGYWNNLEDLISQEADPADGLLQFVNRSQVEAKGVEFELEGHHESGLRGRVSYALQETRDTITDLKLSNSPQHLAKFNLSVPLYRDKVFSGLEVRYHSAVDSGRGTQLGDFWLVNLTLFSRELVPGLDISASLYNLLDETYAYPAGDEYLQDRIPQDGRSFRVKLTYRF